MTKRILRDRREKMSANSTNPKGEDHVRRRQRRKRPNAISTNLKKAGVDENLVLVEVTDKVDVIILATTTGKVTGINRTNTAVVAKADAVDQAVNKAAIVIVGSMRTKDITAKNTTISTITAQMPFYNRNKMKHLITVTPEPTPSKTRLFQLPHRVVLRTALGFREHCPQDSVGRPIE